MSRFPCTTFLPLDSLAYLTAATHGLKEEADTIAEALSTRLDKVEREREREREKVENMLNYSFFLLSLASRSPSKCQASSASGAHISDGDQLAIANRL